MGMKIFQRKLTINGVLSEYKAKGKRRMNACDKSQESSFIDTRNLWIATSIGQEKQYQAIKNSGLLNTERELTFIKFNYRYSEEKGLNYNRIYKTMIEKPMTDRKCRKKYYLPKRSKCGQKSFYLSENHRNLTCDWLKEYHCTQKKKGLKQNIDTERKMAGGSMNIVDLWGQRQLKQGLGSLPCNRDRPKLLKLYSKKKRLKEMLESIVTKRKMHQCHSNR